MVAWTLSHWASERLKLLARQENVLARTISDGTCLEHWVYIHIYLFGVFRNRFFFFLFDQNKFLFLFIRIKVIKVMQQCFFVNWSVFLVPRKYETFPSIQVFFAELRRNFSPCPTRQEGIFFLSGVLVAVISTDNNEYFSTYNILISSHPLKSRTLRLSYYEY